MFKRWLIIIVGIILYSPTITGAAEGVFGTAGKILQIGVDSRAVAMGEAYTAVANDHGALYWNPAGLAHVDRYELAYMHNLWIGEIQDGYISYAMPFYNGGLAFGLNYFNFGEFNKYDIDANGFPVPLEGTFTPFTAVVSAGYGLEVTNLGNIGLALKVISENVDTFSSMSVLMDLGMQIRNIVENLDGAIMVQHLGLPLEGFPLPLNVRLGLAYRLPFLIDQKLDNFLISVDGRLPIPQDDSYSVSVGMEYNYHRTIAGRVGYKVATINELGGNSGLTAGVGLSIANFTLDYSIAPMGDLGLTHQITLSAHLSDIKTTKRHQKKLSMKNRQKQSKHGQSKSSSQEDKLGGMMTSLSGVKLRQPIIVTIKAVKDKKDNTSIKRADFNIKVNLDKKIKRWGLKINDANGNLVRSYSGEGRPPKVTWKGKDKQGKKVKETIFCKYELEILLDDGNVEIVKGKLMAADRERSSQATKKRLQKIYFNEHSAELSTTAIKQLDQAAKEISKQPYLKILISGHGDGGAEKGEAFLISKKRIDRVVRYLTATHKISLKNIATRAFGKKKPLASNQSTAGRKKNRRVELTIVYKK